MNAMSMFKSFETIGAKEFRARLPEILRKPGHAYRVMLQNKPAVAVLPDHLLTRLLELLQEAANLGLFEKMEEESRRRYPWFWTKEFQDDIRQAQEDFKAGRFKRANSVDEMLRELNQ